MTNQEELNKWAAEFLGIDPEEIEYALPKPIPNYRYGVCWNHQWNPCEDRNQCWLVVEKILNEEYSKRIGFCADVIKYACGYSSRVLCMKPEQLIQAAKNSMEGV